MKISIITVVFNGEKYIEDCIKSILQQDYPNIEYIVVDGGSTDRTLTIIDGYRNYINNIITEKDKGMYDALNKGIKLAKGDVIGILNADDMLASNYIISKIVKVFKENVTDAVYGNLNYIKTDFKQTIVRKWVSKKYHKNDLYYGWMPAHPTFYVRKETFNRCGNYSLDFGTAADYELMVRFLYTYQIKAKFLNELFVNMRIGGMSNISFKQRYLSFINDYNSLKKNKLPYPLLTVFLKKISKIKQYLT